MSLTSTDHSRIFARKAAIRLGEAMLIAFAVIIVLTGIDNARRGSLETFQETTAVGDRNYFPLPDLQQKPYPAVVTFQGRSLYPVSYQTVEIRDSKMIRLGKDDTGQYLVYGTHERVPPQEGESERKDETFFFLKTKPNEYLKTRPTSAEK